MPNIVQANGGQWSTNRVCIRMLFAPVTSDRHTNKTHHEVLFAGGKSDTDREKEFFTPSMNTPGRPQKKAEDTWVSDHEYALRVGRAFDLLLATIPEFMRIGLVDYDQNANSSSSSTGATILDILAFRALQADAAQEEAKRQAGTETKELAYDERNTEQQVYHHGIKFRFCAKIASPSDERSTHDISEAEAASLAFSGRSLYFASAHVLRHTLNILFSSSNVEIERIRLERRSCRTTSADVPHKASQSPRHEMSRDETNGLGKGHDSIHMRVRFNGTLRMTGIEHEYTLVFRYAMDDASGRILMHTVERIEPALGRKVSSGAFKPLSLTNMFSYGLVLLLFGKGSLVSLLMTLYLPLSQHRVSAGIKIVANAMLFGAPVYVILLGEFVILVAISVVIRNTLLYTCIHYNSVQYNILHQQ